MRFTLLIAVLFILSFNSNGNLLSAQEKSELDREFESSHQQYQTSFNEYKSSHEAYVLARSQYQRFQTLTSENNAKNATREMLQKRDDVLIDYLNAIKKKLNASYNFDKDKFDRINAQLDEEMNWFTGHKEGLENAGSLADLIEDSNEARDRYNEMMGLVYETLATIKYAQVVRYNERLDDNFQRTKELINNIRGEVDSDRRLDSVKLERIDRWVFNTEGKIQRGEEKLATAKSKLDTIRDVKSTTRLNSPQTVYNTFATDITLAVKDFKDASLYNREIMREIKTK